MKIHYQGGGVMGIRYENLDAITRKHMLNEVGIGGSYISPRLTPDGIAAWSNLLQEAVRNYNDDWLAHELINRNFVLAEESYTRDGVTRLRRINQSHAAQQLAEGEFNRYYIRGLCERANQEGKDHLVIYRGKAVSNPRPESEAKIGARIETDALLKILRKSDFVKIEDAVGISAAPGGPSSGITCKLP
ncbi:hypothetical protein ABQW55_000560 [Xanthomonas citri pv. malvacearum]|uniref:hypothetical protein n=1 Tax=Xanthomonas TaxID=338 RepID=UPI001056C626|nr:hypothetical protein [Xanthomonas citri]MCC4630597.1 hypothetical protein [Xanthomonas citri]NMI14754.1 hypothetical protein [Xanthomonas citri]QGL16128.1 hypothetical protein GH913_04305 [Xanthomonas citri pv. malvacearum]WAW87198.1 hypothetical protein LPY96_01260 [Xanthomonas citri pv. malvacearum]WAW91335.1 hypothetical protein LPY95_00545 [Xanthomonas citri pv. malvacearum]